MVRIEELDWRAAKSACGRTLNESEPLVIRVEHDAIFWIEPASQEGSGHRGHVERHHDEAHHDPTDPDGEEDAANSVDNSEESDIDSRGESSQCVQDQEDQGEQNPDGEEVPDIGTCGHLTVQPAGQWLKKSASQECGCHDIDEPNGVAPHPFGVQRQDASEEDDQDDEKREAHNWDFMNGVMRAKKESEAA